MRLRMSLLLLIGVGLLLQSCVVVRGRVGNPIDETRIQQIEKGISKKEFVVSLLGAPDRIIVGGDKEIFQYYYYDGKSPGLILLAFNLVTLNVKSDNLYVFFDQQGIAQEVVYGNRTKELEFKLDPFGK